MALVIRDRVKETTTTTGTGTYTLAGAVTGFETFASVGNTNTTYYACTDGTDFEVGIGTYASSGTTLARTTILQSSNSDSAVNWGAGTKTIFCTLPAEKMSFLDASGNLVAANGSALTALNASNLASGTVANARLDAQLQDVAGLAVTDSGFIVGDGSNFVLETGATVRTSLGLGTAAVLDTGISNTNVPKFTSGVADDDFLRVDGTAIEGRSATQVLSDIGGQASLTFGISNTNAVKIDSSSVADDEFARFTSSGLESRSASEVRSDIGLGTAATLAVGISNTNVAQFGSGVVDDDFLRVNGTTIEGRSASELASDIGAATTDDATALAIALGQDMANTFKVITKDVAPATSGSPETLYTVQTGSTVVVLGLTLANVHTAQVTGTVQLVSTTTQTNQTQNTTAHIVKDIPVPVGSTVEIMAGNKLILNVGDIVKIDASVADKLSVTMSYMEIT